MFSRRRVIDRELLLEWLAIEFRSPKAVIFYTSVLSGLLTVGDYTRGDAILAALIVPATALPLDLTYGLAGGVLSGLGVVGGKARLAMGGLSSFALIAFGSYMIMSHVIDNPVSEKVSVGSLGDIIGPYVVQEKSQYE